VLPPERIRALVADALGEEHLPELDVPPGLGLWGTIGLDVYLRADGTVWAGEYEVDGGPAVLREVHGVERIICLVITAERRPSLRGLVPVRSEQDVECSPCAGRGTVVATAEGAAYIASMKPPRFYCTSCGGLGFSPAAPASR
jgi:hypothetical protein